MLWLLRKENVLGGREWVVRKCKVGILILEEGEGVRW